MQDILNDKIKDLQNEAESLSKAREQLLSQINEIDIRLHQIVGAMRSLDEIKTDTANYVSYKEDKQQE